MSKNKRLQILTTLLILITSISFAQFSKTDSLGNFYVIKNKLIWQKYYQLDDINKLDQQLKSISFTSGLDIMGHETSTIIKNYKISGSGLPQYAQHDYDAFLVIDIFNDRYRVSVKDINFPDFTETRYYYGMKTNTTRGTLEHYILSGNSIKRTSGSENVLYSFDTNFSDIFDNFSSPIKE
jgi:hypothetical protein